MPLIFKVLSVQFDKKLKFGIVRSKEESIVKKYKIKTFPKIMVLPLRSNKPEYYNGETKFKSIYDFVNIY